ncbi:MAG: hypothetical protein EHM85_11145 [Desulfobacteraceae bacterium]|nr:MAG: hypothetical protein EHM85_11145 [Desulfobacteraceae bacterium]
MLRKSRIDAAGAVHHVIVWGIDRADIFYDDADYKSFLNRLDSDCLAGIQDQAEEPGLNLEI